jgi:hypothetical protein
LISPKLSGGCFGFIVIPLIELRMLIGVCDLPNHFGKLAFAVFSPTLSCFASALMQPPPLIVRQFPRVAARSRLLRLLKHQLCDVPTVGQGPVVGGVAENFSGNIDLFFGRHRPVP